VRAAVGRARADFEAGTAAWPALACARGVPTGAPSTSRASVGEVREGVGRSTRARSVLREARGTSSDAGLALR
jgi:hypothetical protein